MISLFLSLAICVLHLHFHFPVHLFYAISSGDLVSDSRDRVQGHARREEERWTFLILFLYFPLVFSPLMLLFVPLLLFERCPLLLELVSVFVCVSVSVSLFLYLFIFLSLSVSILIPSLCASSLTAL
jgi:hypothetical protein